MAPNVRNIDDVKPTTASDLHQVRGAEGILWAVPFSEGSGRAKSNPLDKRDEPNTMIESVTLIGLDDTMLVGAHARQATPVSDHGKDCFTNQLAEAARAELERTATGAWQEDLNLAMVAVKLAESESRNSKSPLARPTVRAQGGGCPPAQHPPRPIRGE